MQTIRLGAVTMDRVVELGQSSFPTTSILPDATAADLQKHRTWLGSHCLGPTAGDM